MQHKLDKVNTSLIKHAENFLKDFELLLNFKYEIFRIIKNKVKLNLSSALQK